MAVVIETIIGEMRIITAVSFNRFGLKKASTKYFAPIVTGSSGLKDAKLVAPLFHGDPWSG